MTCLPRVRAMAPTRRVWLALAWICLAFVLTSVASLAVTPAGTTVSGTATLQYSGGSVTSNPATFSVTQIAGIALAPVSASLSGAPGSIISFPASITNNGNGSDSFSLTASASTGWTVALYRDDNNDGIRQSTEVTVVSSSGNLSAGATYRFFAAVSVPAGATGNTQATIIINASSALNVAVTTSVSYTASVTQTVAPVVSPVAAQVTAKPGDVVCIPINVTNKGTSQDTLSLSLTSDKGWPAAVIADANQDGIHQSTETTVLTSTGVLTANAGLRAFVQCSVPSNITTQTQGVLSLRITSVLDATKVATGSYTVAVTVQVSGDINGDGSLTLSDVNDAAKMSVGSGTWNTTQRAAADANGDGVVNVLDVTQLLAQSLGQTTPVSQTPTGRQLMLPILEGAAGSDSVIALNTDDGSQIAAFQTTVALDTNLLGVTGVQPGSLMLGDPNWQILYSMSAGKVAVLAYNTTLASLGTGPGSIVTLETTVAATAQAGASTALRWNTPILSDTAGSAFQGLILTDGSLTVGADGGISVLVQTQSKSTPMARAQIRLLLNGQVIQSATTGKNGVCTFPGLSPGSYDITVSAAGYYLERITQIPVSAGRTAEITVSMVRQSVSGTGAVRGFVVDQTGQPIVRAWLYIYRNGAIVQTVQTDTYGCYSKAGLAPGGYSVVAQLTGYPKTSVDVTVVANEMSYANLILGSTSSTPGAISALVLTQTGTSPIAGAKVQAYVGGQLTQQGTSDASGMCLLSGLNAGSYDLSIGATSYYLERMAAVAVTSGQTVDVNFGLVKQNTAGTGAVRGLVTDLSGKPITLSWLYIYRNGTIVETVQTDTYGWYVKPNLPPAAYTIMARLTGYSTASVNATVLANEMSYPGVLRLQAN